MTSGQSGNEAGLFLQLQSPHWAVIPKCSSLGDPRETRPNLE